MSKLNLKNIILFILIIFVGAIAYSGYKRSKTLHTQENIIIEDIEKENYWKSLTVEELKDIISQDPYAFFEPGTELKVSETVDLTGDGIDEGIVVGNGGNNDIYFVLTKDKNGSPFLAKEKEQDGNIFPASLLSLSRVKQFASFKLLPQENGYYTVSQSVIEEEDRWACNGILAYKWNQSLEMFEYTDELTSKYEEEGCTPPIQ